MNLSTASLERFYCLSEQLYSEFSASSDINVVIHYTGVMNHGFSNTLTSRVELNVEEAVQNKQSQKRFFSVFVEVMQNILIHSTPDSEGDVHAGMTIYLQNGKICGRFSNIVKKSQSKQLLERYKLCNGLDRVALKQMYMDRMVKGNLSEKGGAGLGVITIVLRSKNISDVKAYELDNEHDVFEGTFYIDT
jgi:hypothetical protein